MTNRADSKDVLIYQGKRKKSDIIEIHRTNHTTQRNYKRRNICQDQTSLELSGKKEIFQDRQLSSSLPKNTTTNK